MGPACLRDGFFLLRFCLLFRALEYSQSNSICGAGAVRCSLLYDFYNIPLHVSFVFRSINRSMLSVVPRAFHASRDVGGPQKTDLKKKAPETGRTYNAQKSRTLLLIHSTCPALSSRAMWLMIRTAVLVVSTWALIFSFWSALKYVRFGTLILLFTCCLLMCNVHGLSLVDAHWWRYSIGAHKKMTIIIYFSVHIFTSTSQLIEKQK